MTAFKTIQPANLNQRLVEAEAISNDPSGTFVRVLIEEDAVLLVALHHFAVRCAKQGQDLTTLAIEKIAAMATVIGIRSGPPRDLRHGYPWTVDEVREATLVVEESGNAHCLTRLDTLLADLTVADVEGFEEP